MRWAFWRSASSAQKEQRPLPDDVGLPTSAHAAAAQGQHDDDRDNPAEPTPPSSRATPTADPGPTDDAPLSAPAPDVDRTALSSAGPDVAETVTAVRVRGRTDGPRPDATTLAVAATGALAGRLPALSGADGTVDSGEPEDELLHAYAGLLAHRAAGPAARRDDREDLVAVAHLAAAAAAVDAADDPALLLLAGVPADRQLRAAALLLAQTADDGGGPSEQLGAEVRGLFGGR